MNWANPEYFWLLALLPLLIGLQSWRLISKKRPSLTYSNTSLFKHLPGNYRKYQVWLSPIFYWVSFILFVVALARPQLLNTTVERDAEAIDIVMSIDISSSMLAEDLQPNRIMAARQIAAEFISQRSTDRIGINVFARQSFTVCPPTLDHNLVNSLLETVDIGMTQDGTAIGMGIATAINRLKDSEAESRVIVLLTDGMNNSGEVDPVTAAELASSFGIKIYTIGVGSRGTAPYPVDDPIFGRRYQNVSVDIDEEMLSSISSLTDGRYFRATSTEELKGIYMEIDELERTEVEEIIYTDYEDLYSRYLIFGLIAFLGGFLNERFLSRSLLFQP